VHTRRFCFAACPLTVILPPLHARCASVRVLNRHATSSHTSSRTSPGGPLMSRPSSRIHYLSRHSINGALKAERFRLPALTIQRFMPRILVIEDNDALRQMM